MNKKKKVIIGIGIGVFLLIILGISYAFLRNKIYGGKGKIVYHTSGLDVVLEEDSTTSLELTGAVPMSDEDGLKSDKVYRFTIVNRSGSNLKYKVYLDNDTDALKECGDTCKFIPDHDIKYEIKKDKSSINTLENRELAKGRIEKGGRETYELKLWINSEAENEIVGKYFFGKIRVEVVQNFNNLNDPILASNMIPIRYDGTNWVKASEDNWYNYEKQEWANAVTINEDTYVPDLSGNGNDAMLLGNPSYSKEGLELNGTNDGIYLGNILKDLFKTSNTFQIKIKRDDISSTAQDILLGNFNYSNSINYEALNNKYRIWFDAGKINVSEGEAKAKEFVLVTFVYDKEKGQISVYEDNTLKYINTNALYTEYNYDFVFSYIGRDYRSDTSALEGTIEKVMIYNKILTEEEIASNINTEIGKIGENGVHQDHLILYYDFRESSSKKKVDLKEGDKISEALITTMWIWIPRYSYTIGSEDGTNYYGKQGEFLDSTPTKALPGEIDVKFVDKNTTDRGSAKYKVSDGVSGWYTPNAFTFGEEELEGIWVGKFETSNKEGIYESDSNTLTPMIKPNIKSWLRIRVSTLETVSMNMNKSNNIYGFLENETDTHAMKGSEWALAAYLSQSKYGKLGNKSYSGANKETYINNYSLTGCSSGIPNAMTGTNCEFYYDDIKDRGEGKGAAGAGASTTGNIYGIYDMNGLFWEYMMSNYNGYTGGTEEKNSGYNGLLTDGTKYEKGIPYPAEKYYDKYLSTSTNLISQGLGETAGWYGDFLTMVNSTKPWEIRGAGSASTSGAGVFSVGDSIEFGFGGVASFRLVLVNKISS